MEHRWVSRSTTKGRENFLAERRWDQRVELGLGHILGPDASLDGQVMGEAEQRPNLKRLVDERVDFSRRDAGGERFGQLQVGPLGGARGQKAAAQRGRLCIELQDADCVIERRHHQINAGQNAVEPPALEPAQADTRVFAPEDLFKRLSALTSDPGQMFACSGHRQAQRIVILDLGEEPERAALHFLVGVEIQAPASKLPPRPGRKEPCGGKPEGLS
jgi:hypothetical protein